MRVRVLFVQAHELVSACARLITDPPPSTHCIHNTNATTNQAAHWRPCVRGAQREREGAGGGAEGGSGGTEPRRLHVHL